MWHDLYGSSIANGEKKNRKTIKNDSSDMKIVITSLKLLTKIRFSNSTNQTTHWTTLGGEWNEVVWSDLFVLIFVTTGWGSEVKNLFAFFSSLFLFHLQDATLYFNCSMLGNVNSPIMKILAFKYIDCLAGQKFSCYFFTSQSKVTTAMLWERKRSCGAFIKFNFFVCWLCLITYFNVSMQAITVNVHTSGS